MLNKIPLLLSMTLNVLLAVVIVDNNSKSLKTLDFRDAVADNHNSGQLMNNSLASVIPVQAIPASETPVIAAPAAEAPAPALAPAPAPIPAQPAIAAEEALPAPAPAPAKSTALMIKAGNDWAAYKKDAAEDNDVFISNIFRSKRNGEKAMTAAVRRNKKLGKDILFSCVLPEKSGGVFYVIRMAPITAPAKQVATLSKTKADQAYINEIKNLTSQTETEIRETF